MKFQKNIWERLKGITIEEIKKALIRDGCKREKNTYLHPTKKYIITIHYHPKKILNPGLLKNYFLKETGWSIEDLKRLKLI